LREGFTNFDTLAGIKLMILLLPLSEKMGSQMQHAHLAMSKFFSEIIPLKKLKSLLSTALFY
jgi:hypothetical protein